MGIVGKESIKDENKAGHWMTTFDQILNYTKLYGKIIDIVKMDVERSEYVVMQELDIDYWCKYVKQFLVETHPPESRVGVSMQWLKIMRRLEKCFLLFHRDTRFSRENTVAYGNIQSDFQPPRAYKVDLNEYRDENDLIDYMVAFGELYFVNSNFFMIK